ncbi:MAG TPA: hypothetical protein VHD62_03780 [Opitutaceae bacterium]|nr:hypothetical protein [Opitutaceae bacterium]
MSDPVSQPARPVSLFTIVFLFVLFGAFLFVARHYYQPSATAPQIAEPENFSKDLAWKATRESRRQELAALRQQQIAQGQSYAWVDQKAGIVQLPIERAMELTAQKYGAKK